MEKKILIIAILTCCTLLLFNQKVDGATTDLIIRTNNQTQVVSGNMEDVSNAYPGFSWPEKLIIDNRSKQSSFKIKMLIDPDSLFINNITGLVTVRQGGGKHHYTISALKEGVALEIPKDSQLELLIEMELVGDTMGNETKGLASQLKYKFILEEYKKNEQTPSSQGTSKLPQLGRYTSWKYLVTGVSLLLIVIGNGFGKFFTKKV